MNQVKQESNVTLGRRRYSSALRDEQRRATRQRVINAAAELFAGRGYVATTMQAIAEAAGVSVETVYAAGSKRDLLFAALETAVAGDEGSQSVLQRRWMRNVLSEPRLDVLIAGIAEVAATIHARDAPIFAALVQAAAADEGLANAYRQLIGRMRGDAATVAALLIERRGRRHGGVPDDDLADSIFTLAHVDGYQRLVNESGWSTDRYSRWLEQMLKAAVLGRTG